TGWITANGRRLDGHLDDRSCWSINRQQRDHPSRRHHRIRSCGWRWRGGHPRRAGPCDRHWCPGGNYRTGQGRTRANCEGRAMISVAVVGYGYWGPNLVRNIAEVRGARLAAVCDLNVERLKPVSLRYPDVAITANFDELLRDHSIDAVAIATPVSSHFRLAMAALKAGKHVFVEKPIASSAEEAERLVEEA